MEKKAHLDGWKEALKWGGLNLFQFYALQAFYYFNSKKTFAYKLSAADSPTLTLGNYPSNLSFIIAPFI